MPLAAGALALVFSSCSGLVGAGGDAPFSNLASTTVEANDQFEVRQTVKEVFIEKGFRVASDGSNTVTFEKKGDGMTQSAYSNSMNTNPVMIRPVVKFTPAGEGKYKVDCNVSLDQRYRTGGESKQDVVLFGRFGYQAMLDDVKRRLKAGT